MTTTLWNIFTSIVGWDQCGTPIPVLTPIKENEGKEGKEGNSSSDNSKDDNLIQQWEWVFSNAEEIAETKSKERQEEIRKELNTIKKASSSLKFRSFFVDQLSQIYVSYSKQDQERLKESRLNASNRDKIIRDLVRGKSKDWLVSILDRFNQLKGENLSQIDKKRDSFAERWEEKKYKKNISGQIVSMAFHASNQTIKEGMVPVVAADILWSIHLCITRELALDLSESLNDSDHQFLSELIISIGKDLLNLWLTTSINLKNVEVREGLLPSKWEEEEKVKAENIAKMKKIGVLVRFNDTSSNSPKNLSSDKINKNSFEERKSFLASQLVFRKK